MIKIITHIAHCIWMYFVVYTDIQNIVLDKNSCKVKQSKAKTTNIAFGV